MWHGHTVVVVKPSVECSTLLRGPKAHQGIDGNEQDEWGVLIHNGGNPEGSGIADECRGNDEALSYPVPDSPGGIVEKGLDGHLNDYEDSNQRQSSDVPAFAT